MILNLEVTRHKFPIRKDRTASTELRMELTDVAYGKSTILPAHIWKEVDKVILGHNVSDMVLPIEGAMILYADGAAEYGTLGLFGHIAPVFDRSGYVPFAWFNYRVNKEGITIHRARFKRT